MPALQGANQLPWLCEEQKGSVQQDGWREATSLRGLCPTSSGFILPSTTLLWRCYSVISLGHFLGLPAELIAFKIYPVSILVMPLHIICSPKHEKNLNRDSGWGQSPYWAGATLPFTSACLAPSERRFHSTQRQARLVFHCYDWWTTMSYLVPGVFYRLIKKMMD